MELIKWWKNKTAVIFIIDLVLTVVISGLCATLISSPYNWICMLIIVLVGIIIAQIYLKKLIKQLGKDDNNI